MTWETLLFSVCIGTTAGVVIGGVTAGRRWLRTDPAKKEKTARFNRWLIGVLSNLVYSVLGIGLIWTVYFLILGLVDKSQNEYAANAATLIVSVLTVFSIIIAYFEFSHRNDKDSQ